jgi:hypothetical protein
MITYQMLTSRATGLTPVFIASNWAHPSLFVVVGSMLLVFLIFCVVFCFPCFRPLFCLPNVASVSRLSILDCPFGFL